MKPAEIRNAFTERHPEAEAAEAASMLPAGTRLGHVDLTVADLERQLTFLKIVPRMRRGEWIRVYCDLMTKGGSAAQAHSASVWSLG